MVVDVVPGWRLLLFLALRRLSPARTGLLVTSLVASLVFPLHMVTAPTFTVIVTVLGVDDASLQPIAAIQVIAGACLFAEATPSPVGSTAFMLPAGDYIVTAQTNADGRMSGWAMYHVAVHLDRELAVTIDHEVVPLSDLDSIRAVPLAHCPGR
jgi:hypothetical protein